MSVLAAEESRNQETLKALTEASATAPTANVAATTPAPSDVPKDDSFPATSLKLKAILN